jgi:hypothetical protein
MGCNVFAGHFRSFALGFVRRCHRRGLLAESRCFPAFRPLSRVVKTRIVGSSIRAVPADSIDPICVPLLLDTKVSVDSGQSTWIEK